MMRSYRSLAKKELLAQPVTSALILLAVILSTMMTAVIGQSAGVLSAMRLQQAVAIGGDCHASFVQMNASQVEALRQDPRLSFVGTHVVVGSMELDNTLILGLSDFQEDVSAVYPPSPPSRRAVCRRPPWKSPCRRMCWAIWGPEGSWGRH